MNRTADAVPAPWGGVKGANTNVTSLKGEDLRCPRGDMESPLFASGELQ